MGSSVSLPNQVCKIGEYDYEREYKRCAQKKSGKGFYREYLCNYVTMGPIDKRVKYTERLGGVK